jgi:4-carboxymuconolactone decarboxylase
MSTQSVLRRDFEIPPQLRTDRQQQMVRHIEQGPRGRVMVNLRAWLHNMDFLDVAEPFGLYLSQFAPVSKRQKEILVLVHAHFWDAKYEWDAHTRHALKAGITQEQIDAISKGLRPVFEDAVESLTWELVAALHTVRHIDDDLYERSMRVFGHKGVSDLIGLIGLYTMVAMTLNFYDVPPGHAPAWQKAAADQGKPAT